jgi:hypothetical protein
LAPGIESSSASLSWPQGNEFLDSYIKLQASWFLSHRLSHDGPDLGQFLEDIPDSSLHGLRWIDYRKSLTGDTMDEGPGILLYVDVLGLPGLRMVIDGASFRSLKADHFDDFNPPAFLRVRSSIPPISSLRLQVLT